MNLQERGGLLTGFGKKLWNRGVKKVIAKFDLFAVFVFRDELQVEQKIG